MNQTGKEIRTHSVIRESYLQSSMIALVGDPTRVWISL
jgi:hypothetical protein